MNLKSLLVESKPAWVEYPGLEGFEVQVVNLSRDRLISLQKSCTVTKFSRSTRQPVEEIDQPKFIKEFTTAVIKDWKGFKYKYLEQMVLVDISAQDPEAELEFSIDNAISLVSASTHFDTWLNEVVFDLDNFRTKPAGGVVGTPE